MMSFVTYYYFIKWRQNPAFVPFLQLNNYLKDGCVEIDNNFVENAIPPFYLKYYGFKMMMAIFIIYYVAMVTAALIIEFLFQLFHPFLNIQMQK